jgi:hypothetical protein
MQTHCGWVLPVMVYQNISKTSIDQPWGHALAMNMAIPGYFSQCNFKFIDLVVARLVHPGGLAGGANEHATEKITQTGVVVPVQDQTGQQFGPAQEGLSLGVAPPMTT